MAMVGVMATGDLREQAVSYLNDAKMHGDTSSKTSLLKLLKEILLYRDPSLLEEFVPHLMELQTERAAPIRNFLVQMIEEIGLKYYEHLVVMVPVLLALMRDGMPAVARRAISAGSTLFRNTLQQVALQGIYSGRVDKKLEESWTWMTTLKDAICSASQEHKNDGVRLVAVKFVETVILLFTPEPNGPAHPPPQQQHPEKQMFNVAWLLGGHPILDAAALGQEASRYLALLLDKLRGTEISKLPGPVAVVVVNSLVSIAKQRPSFYGRVLPVLLGLVSNCEPVRVTQISGLAQALNNAFVNLLKCTHSGAGPWRERVISALKVLKGEDTTETSTQETDRAQPMERKRSTIENGNSVEHPLKRVRGDSTATYAGVEETQLTSVESNIDSSGSTEMSPLHQMVAMISALVSKGECAAPSIDLLIASLTADMLADMVIENMKNLPPSPPDASSDASGSIDPGFMFNFGVSLSSVTSLGQSLASSLSLPQKLVSEPTDPRRDLSRDPRRNDPRQLVDDVKIEEPEVDISNNSVDMTEVLNENFHTSSVSEETGFIPGISLVNVKQEPADNCTVSMTTDVSIQSGSDRTPSLAISLSRTAVAACTSPVHPSSDQLVEPTDAMDISETKPTVSAPYMPVVHPISALSVPEIKKEADLSAPEVKREAALCAPEIKKEVPGTKTVLPSSQPVIPVLHFDIDQQMALWKMLLVRIFESYKLVKISGASELRLSVLARLIIGSDGDDEAWSMLKTHVLEDYQNHEGHELTIYTLYQLLSESVYQEDEMMVESTALRTYNTFLLAVAEGLRDTLPPSDKSLSKLLAEAPILPKSALDLLEALCNPASENTDGLESRLTERITQGLSAVWSLILLRPTIRSACLDIALKCTVHELEEVRTKAIRLVANKLYPLSYISKDIEEFATKMLYKILEMGSSQEVSKDSAMEELQSDQVTDKELDDKAIVSGLTFEEDQSKSSKGLVSIQDAHRCMSLYFALCTKKNSLLREIFSIYKDVPKSVKQAIHKHMPVLVRTIGASSSDFLQIIADPPSGSKNLILLVLHVLTETSSPSTELISAVKHLYDTKMKDAKVLTPILSSLSKDEVLPIFPRLVALPSQDFKTALDRILQGTAQSGPALTPAEVLILIHGIDPEKDHVSINNVKEACNVCFQQRSIFTQQVLAKVLNQLVEQTPLPMMFMRTVILAVGSFRSLVSFVMEILSRLVSKQVWKLPNLWVGFLKCAEQTQPHCYNVLLQLPAVQLEKALNRIPHVRAPLTAHASKASVRSTLPRATLVVLGLAQDALPPETSSVSQEMSTAVSNANSETQATEQPSTS